MHFGIVTLFPDMFSALKEEGVIARAIQSGKLSLSFYSVRDFADNAYRKVDEEPFGGGPGMVMMAEPLALAIEAAKSEIGAETPVIYLSPRGERLVQSRVPFFLEKSAWILVCGRYEGVDQRLIDRLVDYEVSIGDFVLSGGELPAMVLIDVISRHIPGVLGNKDSALFESFMQDDFDHAQNTRPRVWRGESVPEVLLSGHHAKIEKWRHSERSKKSRGA
jgi:tRNA (guanine37-N1)-methyltransferase